VEDSDITATEEREADQEQHQEHSVLFLSHGCNYLQGVHSYGFNDELALLHRDSEVL